MLSTVYCAALCGIDGFEVTVECNTRQGLEHFEIIGLPDASVREAKERIKSAIENSGYVFEECSVVINMAPADKKKEGSAFDLAMLVGLMVNMNHIKSTVDLSTSCFIGELSLSGEIRPVRGALSMCLAARQKGKKKIYLPVANASEASVVENIEVYGISNVRELILILNGEKNALPATFDMDLFEKTANECTLDFADVKGQYAAKRAIEIAVAGGHNILMIGPPGTGKSMLAKRIPGIMPKMTFDEALESTKIYSVAGELKENDSILFERPFRSPHHTMSAVSLAGGGKIPMPGEISLAHNGVLFLDELPEFSKTAAEVLRQPVEDKKITISRAAGRLTFPCSFMLVCAMNPCKCGYYGHPSRKCTCKKTDIQKYMSKISGPLLDRIDIQIEVSSLTYDEMSDAPKAESSAVIRERVNEARNFARKRFHDDGRMINSNSEMEAADIDKYCRLDEQGDTLLRRAYSEIGMSARAHARILKVARTIADLSLSPEIKAPHIAEAIRLRGLDRKYW